MAPIRRLRKATTKSSKNARAAAAGRRQRGNVVIKYIALFVYAIAIPTLFISSTLAQNRFFDQPQRRESRQQHEPYIDDEDEVSIETLAPDSPTTSHALQTPQQHCRNDFNSKLLLTSNADGQLTAYRIVSNNQISRKWQQMTVCSREDTFTTKRKPRFYGSGNGRGDPDQTQLQMNNHDPYSGLTPHEYATPDDSMNLVFQIFGKHMAEKFINEHQHRAAFDKAVREIQIKHSQLAVTGHITTDFFHLRVSDGRIIYMDDRNAYARGGGGSYKKDVIDGESDRENCGMYLTLGVTRTDKRIEIVDKLTLTEIYSETFSTFKLELIQPLNPYSPDTESNATHEEPRMVRHKRGTGKQEQEFVHLAVGDFVYTFFSSNKNPQISDAWLIDRGQLAKFKVAADWAAIDFTVPDGSLVPVSPGEPTPVTGLIGDDSVTFGPETTALPVAELGGSDGSVDSVMTDTPIVDKHVLVVGGLACFFIGMIVTYKCMILYISKDPQSTTGHIIQGIQPLMPSTMTKIAKQVSHCSHSCGSSSDSSLHSPLFGVVDPRPDEKHTVRPIQNETSILEEEPTILGNIAAPTQTTSISISKRPRKSTFTGPQLQMPDECDLPEVFGSAPSDPAVSQSSDTVPHEILKVGGSSGPPRKRQLSEASNYMNSRFREDWQPISIIGAGGFGIVFKATNILTEETRAVKRILLPDMVQHTEEYEKFKREARTNARLTHGNITRYYACWIETTTKGQQSENDLEYYKLARGQGEWPQMVGECDGEGVDDTAVRQALGVEVDESGYTAGVDDSEVKEEASMWRQLDEQGSSGFSFGTKRMETDRDSLRLPAMSQSAVSEISVIFDNETYTAKRRFRKDSQGTLVHDTAPESSEQSYNSSSAEDSSGSSQLIYIKPLANQPVPSARTPKTSTSSHKKFKFHSDPSSTSGDAETTSESESSCCVCAGYSESSESEESGDSESVSEPKSESYWQNSMGHGNKASVTTGDDSVAGSARSMEEQEEKERAGVSEKEVHYLYLVMGYCSGGSLRTWLDTRRTNLVHQTEQPGWTYHQCLAYLTQMCNAIEYLHKHKCIHRDIKPGNVMFDKDPALPGAQVKLGDFGLSRTDASEIERTPTVWSPTMSGSAFGGDFLRLPSKADVTKGVGTRLYMAPELLSPRKDTKAPHLRESLFPKYGNYRFTSAVDVYALGLVTIELFTDFSTQMSRLLTLENAKDQHQGLAKIRHYADGDEREDSIWRYRKLALIVQDMLKADPRDRPTAGKLVKRLSDIGRDKSSAPPVLKDKISPLIATPTQMRIEEVKAAHQIKRSQSTSLTQNYSLPYSNKPNKPKFDIGES